MGELLTETRLDDFEAFCGRLTLENGSKMALEAWQRRVLADYFGGCRETLLLLPKKQGKSTLLAAIALHHALEVDNCEFLIVASSRDQAGILYRQAVGFVRRTVELQDHFSIKEGYREIRTTRDYGRIRVLAADASTADGVLPTGVAADELHRWKSSELYSVLRSGLTPRNGQMLGISTAGDDPESMLGRMRQRALSFPAVRRAGAYTYARSVDGQFVLHEYALDDDADISDMAVVKTANPASWLTEELLREIYDSPSTEPWSFARFHANMWVAGENAAIDPVALRKCGGGVGLEEGEPCWAGLDVGWRFDSTALVPFTYDADEGLEIVGVPTVIDAPNDGTSTHPDTILEAIRRLHQRNPIERLVFDPRAEGEILAHRIRDEIGIVVEPHSQDPSPMADACMGLAESIRAGSLVHPDDPELTAHLLAAASKVVSGERWRFVKQKGGRKIDAAISLAMVRAKRMDRKKKPTLAPEEFMAICA